MIDRRGLLRRAVGGVLSGAIRLPARASPCAGSMAVLVRQPDGALVAVARGVVRPWAHPLPATPTGEALPDAALAELPDALGAMIPAGTVGYWMVSPDGQAIVYRDDSGDDAVWRWRGRHRAIRLELPADLEPARPTGTTARWFHGAVVDSTHLGSGTLRLFAVDLEGGEIVLSHERDRRLELAATAVSESGAIVAHVQAGNTGVEMWATDLRYPDRMHEADVVEESAPAAASAIDLRVAEDGDAALVAAGLRWDWPGHPEPAVHVLCGEEPGKTVFSSLPGELVGIVTAPPDDL